MYQFHWTEIPLIISLLCYDLIIKAGPITSRTKIETNQQYLVSNDTTNTQQFLSFIQRRGEKVRFDLNGVLHNKMDFLLNIPNKCENSSVLLLIVVCSSVRNLDLRQAIRETWMQSGSENTKIIFLLGQTDDYVLKENVYKESRINNDIVLADIPDSYYTLTLKSIAMLKWVNKHCSQAQFVLKCDDDIFINIPLLTADLNNIKQSNFIMGQIIAGAEPIRDKSSKWYTPEVVYSDARYPEYISGCAYVISGDLVQTLYESTKLTPFYWIEDVYITGMCAANVGAIHVFNAKFGFKSRDMCVIKNVITSHKLSVSAMKQVWLHFKNNTQC